MAEGTVWNLCCPPESEHNLTHSGQIVADVLVLALLRVCFTEEKWHVVMYLNEAAMER